MSQAKESSLSANPSQWAKANAKHIERALESRYGKGWRACFPESVQAALIQSEILNLVMTQALDKYEPAQSLVREILPVFSSNASK